MTATPHDALFKAVFRQPAHAAAELRHILPAHVVQEIDWSTLTLASSEHVDPELEQSRGDLLFTASVAGRPGHIFFLLEHQSTQDHRMPLRLADYMNRVWHRHWDEHPKSPVPLPIILPVVLAQTHPRWTAACQFQELFDFPPECAPFVPHFCYAIDDLARTSDDELRQRPLGVLPRTTLWLMRNVRTPRAVLEHLPEWREPLTEILGGPEGAAWFLRLLRYVSVVMEELQFEEIRDTLVELIPTSETYVMTIAQQLEAKGRQEGRVEGRQEGRVETLRGTLLAILERRGLSVSADHRASIHACDDSAILEGWLLAAVTASTVEGIFQDE